MFGRQNVLDPFFFFFFASSLFFVVQNAVGVLFVVCVFLSPVCLAGGQLLPVREVRPARDGAETVRDQAAAADPDRAPEALRVRPEHHESTQAQPPLLVSHGAGHVALDARGVFVPRFVYHGTVTATATLRLQLQLQLRNGYGAFTFASYVAALRGVSFSRAEIFFCLIACCAPMP